MAVINVVDIRKVVDKGTFPAGVYPGTVTGFVATFKMGYDIYECHLMKGSTRVNQPCHVLVDCFGGVVVNTVD